ncbi:MAG: hypothetical protein H0U73_10370 [Tatlockia sp.]|nr:hypothetical protein [Tatlockia sp.]
MPQITLKLSNNIDLTELNFTDLFRAIHKELELIPSLDVTTCQSGVIQEVYSYLGLGDKKTTKIYLEILWLENQQRLLIKNDLAKNLMKLLKNKLTPPIEAQNLLCNPRIRIGNLGVIGEDYYIVSQ